jgi:phage FluMu protein Com
MRCAKCQKQLPQTDGHSGLLLSITAGSLLVAGTSYALSFLTPTLPIAAGAIAAGAFSTACQRAVRTYSANATEFDDGGVACPRCTHVNFWTL